MKTAVYCLLGVILFGCLIARGYGQCTCDRPTAACSDCTWRDIPVNTDPASLDTPNGNPLGFAQRDLPGADNPDQEVCVNFTFPSSGVGSGNIFYLTVLAEGPLGVNFCADFEDDNEPTCGLNQVSFCQTVPSTSADICFTCQSGCETGQSAGVFYFRPFFNRTENDDEFFCNDYPPTLAFPSSLIVVTPPISVSVSIPTNDPNAGASRLIGVYLPVLLLIALVAKLLSVH